MYIYLGICCMKDLEPKLMMVWHLIGCSIIGQNILAYYYEDGIGIVKICTRRFVGIKKPQKTILK